MDCPQQRLQLRRGERIPTRFGGRTEPAAGDRSRERPHVQAQLHADDSPQLFQGRPGRDRDALVAQNASSSWRLTVATRRGSA